MISPERAELLQAGWVRLLATFGASPADAYPSFDRLVAAYSAPTRHYHNLEHLNEMFRIASRLANQTDDPVALQLAIWFHDAVYDTRAKDNEERSAEFAGELLAPLGVPPAVIERVGRLVRATAHLASAEPPADRDTAVLLDADLAILGATPERYLRYARDIRLEYHWVPEADYRKGRAAVLRAFLARPRIYHNPIMFEAGEERARANLAGELKALSE
jgi:predicted metal-dependent HD superfamily phosphohydrolase